MQPFITRKERWKSIKETEKEMYGMKFRKKALRNKIALVLFVIIAGLFIYNAIDKSNNETIVNEQKI